jgi:hypothetical protein
MEAAGHEARKLFGSSEPAKPLKRILSLFSASPMMNIRFQMLEDGFAVSQWAQDQRDFFGIATR